MMLSRSHAGMLTVGLMVLSAGLVSGQDYPTKPIRIVCGAAGGGADNVSRQITQGMSGSLGQPVIVDNRASIIAVETVAKAPPDGYTLLALGGGTVWMRPLLEKTPWDPVRDFAPISLLVREINVLAVHPSLPVKSVKELIALAKARPAQLNYATSTIGGTTDLASELFMSMAGVNIVKVPYKGTAPALIALLAGETQVMIVDAGTLAPHMKSGRLRALAVTSAQPSALFPGVPTVAASGLPGYEAVSLTGIWAPAKTPAAIINRLNQEIVRVLIQPDLTEKFLKAGIEAVGSSPEQFAAMIKADIVRMGKVIKDAGIKVN